MIFGFALMTSISKLILICLYSLPSLFPPSRSLFFLKLISNFTEFHEFTFKSLSCHWDTGSMHSPSGLDLRTHDTRTRTYLIFDVWCMMYDRRSWVIVMYRYMAAALGEKSVLYIQVIYIRRASIYLPLDIVWKNQKWIFHRQLKVATSVISPRPKIQ